MENIRGLWYDTTMNYGISARETGTDVHYFVKWSPLATADRWEINAKVPPVAGIYEIYWMDGYKHLRMLALGQTHYGGLRSELRRLTDPDLTFDTKTRKILENEKIWYRYAPSNSPAAMADAIWYFMETYFPENPGVEHSGRYQNIYMNESAPNKLIWVP